MRPVQRCWRSSSSPGVPGQPQPRCPPTGPRRGALPRLLGVPSPRTAAPSPSGALHKCIPARKVTFVALTNFGLSGPGLSEILRTRRTIAFNAFSTRMA